MMPEPDSIAMVDANVQREEVLPSEKAFAYKMKLDAIKKQGSRKDLKGKVTSPPRWGELEAADVVSKSFGVSGTQVQRLVRFTELIPNLLNMVDEKRLALAVSVELSYLNNMQQWIYEYIHENGMIKQEQLMELRQHRDNTEMPRETLNNLLNIHIID